MRVEIDARSFSFDKGNYEDIYTYHLKEGNKFPLGNFVVEFAGLSNENINIEGVEYFKNCTIYESRLGKKVGFGKALFTINDEVQWDVMQKYFTNYDNKIGDMYLNLEFLAQIIKFKYFNIGNRKVDFGGGDDETNKDIIKKYKMIKDLVDFLKLINSYDPTEKLSLYIKDNKIKFYEIVLSILHNQELFNTSDTNGQGKLYHKFKLNNKEIPVVAIRQKSGNYIFEIYKKETAI